MAKTTTASVPTAQAYFCTSHSLGTGSTSTPVQRVWRQLNDHLVEHQLPVSGAELSAGSGLSLSEIEHMFSQIYYQRNYGFSRFNTVEAWQQWAREHELLYVPELHDPKPAPDPAGTTDAEESEAEEA